MWEWELEDLERIIKTLNNQKAFSVVFSCHNYCGNILDKYQSDPQQLAIPCNAALGMFQSTKHSIAGATLPRDAAAHTLLLLPQVK